MKPFVKQAPDSFIYLTDLISWGVGWGGVILPYMGYIGMYFHQRYGFSAILVINEVLNLA